MKYKDEFHIASTAILLCAAMLGISVVVPKESRVQQHRLLFRKHQKLLQRQLLNSRLNFLFTRRKAIMIPLMILDRT